MTYGKLNDASKKIYWVKDNILSNTFPDVSHALRDPDGLLAIGGDLSCERLLEAYRNGIFPWFNEGQPILWWSPDPRCVIEPNEIKISRSLRKRLRSNIYTVTFNQNFQAVMELCAAPRKDVNETWITNDIKLAYLQLHQQGYAHSVETWHEDKLVGGLYGIALGKVFFGESMFSHRPDASKVALVNLVEQLQNKKFRIIDCQVHSKHLQSLGAKPVHREMFIQYLRSYCNDDKILNWST